MNLGPVMLDIAAAELDAEDRDLLRHPAVGGVILFSRNYVDRGQLCRLTAEIHALREPPLLVSVDHEGGAVQRFRRDFTALPSAAAIGDLYDRDAASAKRLARDLGWLAAAELRAAGVDFSFAPVLDVRDDSSRVINRRAFHADPEIIALLADQVVQGLKHGGMAAVGKHFPGHGSVVEDSHRELPVDPRPLVDIQFRDLVPFERLIHRNLLGIMPAHVCYPQVDARAACFSEVWIRGVLRGQLGFQGAVFSDDLSMHGARPMGDLPDRARHALHAGCDMVLVCNDRPGTMRIVEALRAHDAPTAHARLIPMHGRGKVNEQELFADARWREVRDSIERLPEALELDLGDDERIG